MSPYRWMNNVTGNALLPDDTKPLPDPMYIYDH